MIEGLVNSTDKDTWTHEIIFKPKEYSKKETRQFRRWAENAADEMIKQNKMTVSHGAQPKNTK